MAFELKWTRRASDRLDEIERFIAADNPTAARREIVRLLEQVELLMRFPPLGHVYRKASDTEYREITVGKYRIFYLVKTHLEAIDIITVWHGARAEPDLP